MHRYNYIYRGEIDKFPCIIKIPIFSYANHSTLRHEIRYIILIIDILGVYKLFASNVIITPYLNNC